MKQDKNLINTGVLKVGNLADLRELIQDDIICCVDSHIQSDGLRSVVINRNKLKTQLCQIVVDRINEEIDNDRE